MLFISCLTNYIPTCVVDTDCVLNQECRDGFCACLKEEGVGEMCLKGKGEFNSRSFSEIFLISIAWLKNLKMLDSKNIYTSLKKHMICVFFTIWLTILGIALKFCISVIKGILLKLLKQIFKRTFWFSFWYSARHNKTSSYNF